MSGPPDFSELVGPDVPRDERERLRRAHELLVAAGPPPSPTAPSVEAPGVRAWPRRKAARVLLAAALAAVLAAAAIGGYAAGRASDSAFETRRVVELRGTDAAASASAVIRIGERDENGNWPMLVSAHGLKPLPGGYYVLLLTKNGRPVAPCGTFQAGSGRVTTVRLSASYRLTQFDGWVVRPYLRGRKAFNRRILLTT